MVFVLRRSPFSAEESDEVQVVALDNWVRLRMKIWLETISVGLWTREWCVGAHLKERRQIRAINFAEHVALRKALNEIQ